MPAFVVSPAPREGARMAVAGPFADRQAAELHATRNDTVIEHAVDVIWSGRILVDVFNAITGSRLKKFESFAVGVRRLLEALPQYAIAPVMAELEPPREEYVEPEDTSPIDERLAEALTSPTPAPETEETRQLDPVVLYDRIAAQESAPPVAEVTPPARTRLPLRDDHVVRVLCPNPKRPGTAAHALFLLYRDGMTCAEYLQAGGTKAGLSWDRTHGFIRLDPAS